MTNTNRLLAFAVAAVLTAVLPTASNEALGQVMVRGPAAYYDNAYGGVYLGGYGMELDVK